MKQRGDERGIFANQKQEQAVLFLHESACCPRDAGAILQMDGERSFRIDAVRGRADSRERHPVRSELGRRSQFD
jgi:hypothetical protein